MRQANARRDLPTPTAADLTCWMSIQNAFDTPNGTEVLVEWDREFHNPEDMWVDSQPERITIPERGYYLIYSEIGIQGTGVSDYSFYMRIVLNGTTDIVRGDVRVTSGLAASCANAITLYRFEVDDYVEVYVSHSSASTHPTGGEFFTSQFGVKYIGASP